MFTMSNRNRQDQQEPRRHETGNNDSAVPFKISDKGWFMAQWKTLMAGGAALVAATTWVTHVNEEGAKIDALAGKVEEHGQLLREIKAEVDAIAVVCGAKGVTSTASPAATWTPRGPRGAAGPVASAR
jgi:hypothetical protein